jgi:hypothetical protein
MKKNQKYLLVTKETEDGERLYLMDKKLVIIDFWNEFGSCSVEEFSQNGNDYINVIYEDEMETDCLGLVDANGNIIIRKCINYDFIENKIKVLRSGYMLFGDSYDSNEYWSILDSEVIVAVQSIEYLDELKIFLVDEINCYDNNLNYIGNKLKEIETEYGTTYLLFEVVNSSEDTERKLQGLLCNGKIVLEHQYEKISESYNCSQFLKVEQGKGDYNLNSRYDYNYQKVGKGEGDHIRIEYYIEGFSVFEYQIGSKFGAVVLENETILFNKELESDDCRVLFINYNCFVFYFNIDTKTQLIVYDNISLNESSYIFDDLLSITFSDLIGGYKSLFYGINRANKKTTLFSIDKINHSRIIIQEFDSLDIEEHLTGLHIINKVS